ncbi:hypothetical protein [Haloferax denitrificans]|uniref:hypothetical protein n=1 Tax=Haloferax denitrificans TaxID=35745 RepID=UPI003C6EB0F8
MKHDQANFDRRTILRTTAVLSVGGLTGCLNGSGDTDGGTTTPNNDADEHGILRQVAVEGTELGVELGSRSDVEQINLIQPNGELFGTREVAAGVQQVSFEIGTAYDPGDYRVIAVHGEEMVAETSVEIRPQLEIIDVGLFRNNPDKPWDAVYGESETNRIQNAEACVSVHNSGTGPDAAVSLQFSGDVPNPIENPRDSGLYDAERVTIPPGETRDLFSSSLPFGAHVGNDGMGCIVEKNTGEFSVLVGSRAFAKKISERFTVEYSGSDVMRDCSITIYRR